MINFDYLTLRAFLNENRNFLVNSRFQKIRQTSAQDLIFILRNNGESRKLYININPDIYHIAFMTEAGEIKRSLTYPQKPPMFCMLLRKYLNNAKIINVSQPPYERILELELECLDEIDDNKVLILAIELMGKHSNIILYDKNSRLIIGCAHNVGENKSQIRVLYGGIPYVYPPAASYKTDFLRYFGHINYDNLADEFRGFSKYFAGLCKGHSLEEIKDLLTTDEVNPALNDKEYSIFGDLISGEKVFTPSVNDMLDEYYSQIQYSKKVQLLKSQLANLANTKYKKIKSTISKIETIRNRRGNIEKYKLYGELLTAYAYRQEDYIKKIILEDYNTGKYLTIPLDETLNMIDNAKLYFKLYIKSKHTKEKTLNMILKFSELKNYWEGVIYNINNADSLELLEDIAEELGFQKNVSRKKNIRNIKTIDISGYTVYIGRNNKQNDYIVSKIAKNDDIWFHIKDRAGAHILLKITDTLEPDDNVIFECCKLAKQYSFVPENEKSGVIYTRCKYLRKLSNAALGYVTYRNEKEIYL